MLQQLILNNHLQSAKAFKHQSPLTWKQVLLTSFTKGNRQQFFSVFDLLRKQQKLQFYLRVYFLIYSIHPHINVNARTNSIPEKQIVSFRQFLDTKGADLAKTSQFLEFYALPFIKKPLQHGAFKTLFGKNWVGNLKEKLTVYIGIEEENMKNAVKSQFTSIQVQNNKEPTKQPQPLTTPQQISPTGYEQKFRILQKKNKQLFDQLQQIKQTYHHLQQNHQQMIQDFNQYMMDSQSKWFQSYKELVKTSRVLLEIVGGLTMENPKLERRYIQCKRKVEKYERFVARKLQDLLSMSQDISVFDKPSVNEISQYTMKSGYTSKSWLNNNNNPNNNTNILLGDKNVSNNNYSQLQSINYTHTGNQNNITSYVQIDEYIATNFSKLNQQFMGNNNKLSQQERIGIIEGFSWRLLKSKSPLIRRYYCIGLIKYNFLGLGKVDAKSKNNDLQICTHYLCTNNTNSNTNLVDSILQLLNYMKVDYYSRQWLFKQNNIIYPLMQTMAQQLQQNNLQSFIISLDILSTISAYKDYRQSIIQTQLPIFLLNILQSYPKIFESQQLMQLIMMILMNVSAFKEGLQLLREYENIFSTLSVAFQHDYHDIIMLVNGFYYTLLGDKVLYQLAIESNMRQFVSYLLSQQQDYSQHERQLKFIEKRLQKFDDGNNNKNNNNRSSKNNNRQQQQQEDLFLIDSQNEYEQIEIIQQQMQNLQQYIKAHQQLTLKYSLNQQSSLQQQKHIQSINQQFINLNKLRKQQQNNNKNNIIGSNNNNNNEIISVQQLEKPIITTTKSIPDEKKPINKKSSSTSNNNTKVNMKTQQVQVSMINITNSVNNNNSNNNLIGNVNYNKNNNNKVNNNNLSKPQQQQSTIKQQIFNSPPAKIDYPIIDASQPIPKNTKQAQFMGLLSKQKNPTFAKQKTQPNQNYSSPTNIPINQNANLPQFGLYTPPPQLGPQQKTRRKQILKQLNEEIQSKNKQKVQKHKTKLQYDKTQEDKITPFIQRKQPFQQNVVENGPKAARGNAHMKNQSQQQKQKPPKQKEEQRKAFQSRPKIHRTPPKDDE